MFNKKFDYDLIVLGSGAGGSVGAHYAISLGKQVAIFEKEFIGGECPNIACVPTKALLHAAGSIRNCPKCFNLWHECVGHKIRL